MTYHIEWDVSFDWRSKSTGILIDTGDGESIFITREVLKEMMDTLDDSDIAYGFLKNN